MTSCHPTGTERRRVLRTTSTAPLYRRTPARARAYRVAAAAWIAVCAAVAAAGAVPVWAAAACAVAAAIVGCAAGQPRMNVLLRVSGPASSPDRSPATAPAPRRSPTGAPRAKCAGGQRLTRRAGSSGRRCGFTGGSTL